MNQSSKSSIHFSTRRVSLMVLCLVSFQWPLASLHATSSMPPSNRNGAPPSGMTCALCHSGFGTGTTELVFRDGLLEYEPGETYPIQVRITDAGQARFGFSMTSRRESSLTTSVGTWTSGNNNSVYDSGTSIGHANAPFASDTFTFNMNWTAPAQDIGPVRFYLAANAANGNGNFDSGDHIYTKQLVIQPALPFESFWASLDDSGGWRFTGDIGQDKAGIGYVYDQDWPLFYSYSLTPDGSGSWFQVYKQSSDADAFWAYNLNGGYFIRVLAWAGWYYSFQPGEETWHPANF